MLIDFIRKLVRQRIALHFRRELLVAGPNADLVHPNHRCPDGLSEPRMTSLAADASGKDHTHGDMPSPNFPTKLSTIAITPERLFHLTH